MDEFNDDRCDHGILFEYECELCEQEQKEFWLDLLTRLGDGNLVEGKKVFIEMMRQTRKKHGN